MILCYFMISVGCGVLGKNGWRIQNETFWFFVSFINYYFPRFLMALIHEFKERMGLFLRTFMDLKILQILSEQSLIIMRNNNKNKRRWKFLAGKFKCFIIRIFPLCVFSPLIYFTTKKRIVEQFLNVEVQLSVLKQLLKGQCHKKRERKKENCLFFFILFIFFSFSFGGKCGKLRRRMQRKEDVL